MRLQTAFNMLCRATSGRLDRLIRRLDCSAVADVRPRHYVRLVWAEWVIEILRQRREYHFSES